MKTPVHSKTIWVGGLTILLSLCAMIVDFWALLSPDQVEMLNDYFGPSTMATLGILMVVLRVVTTSPVVFMGNPHTAPERPDEPLG